MIRVRRGWIALLMLPVAAACGDARPAGAQPPRRLEGERLVARGKLDEADSAFRTAIAARGPDTLTARGGLAALLAMRGRREDARPLLRAVIAAYERGGRLRADEMLAAARALREMGAEDPQAFKDALRAYDRAIAADSSNLDARVELGALFLEKFNGADARAMFASVLAVDSGHPGALAGEAARRQFDGQPGSAELARRALARDPAHVPALTHLATLALASEDYAEATAQARRALDANPASLEALAALAIARRGAGDGKGYEEARSRIAAVNPRWSGLPRLMAEHAVRTRRYGEAVTLAREAVRLDSRDWRAYAVLGINLLRTGSAAAAKDTLEVAFAGDPYDVWTKNTLDLLDTFSEYSEVSTGRFVLFLDRRHADVIAAYAGPLAEEAFASLAERYRYRPPTPIRLEMYRTSADFSVRTVGLPGLGALGVSFGSTLAMDSPAARERGSYHWASTMWHEIAHAFTLGASGHNVPRWVTEGLSVLEERRARPGWGDDPGPAFLAAYLEGKLLPVSRLNEGFVKPTYPEQIGFSYYQASLVMEMLEREFGMSAIRALLGAYRAGTPATEALTRVLQLDATALDLRYDAWFRRRFGGAVEAVRRARESRDPRDTSTFMGLLSRGAALADSGRLDAAVAVLQRAKTAYPEYTGTENAYRQLADIYRSQGRPRDAALELGALTALAGGDYGALLALSAARDSAGDPAGAAEALERAVYVYPFEIPVHERLATLLERVGRPTEVLRERRVIVALNPVDRADALYRLARAELAAGRRDEARRSVVRALEIAPMFAEAQRLLLQLRSESTP